MDAFMDRIDVVREKVVDYLRFRILEGWDSVVSFDMWLKDVPNDIGTFYITVCKQQMEPYWVEGVERNLYSAGAQVMVFIRAMRDYHAEMTKEELLEHVLHFINEQWDHIDHWCPELGVKWFEECSIENSKDG